MTHLDAMKQFFIHFTIVSSCVGICYSVHIFCHCFLPQTCLCAHPCKMLCASACSCTWLYAYNSCWVMWRAEYCWGSRVLGADVGGGRWVLVGGSCSWMWMRGSYRSIAGCDWRWVVRTVALKKVPTMYVYYVRTTEIQPPYYWERSTQEWYAEVRTLHAWFSALVHVFQSPSKSAGFFQYWGYRLKICCFRAFISATGNADRWTQVTRIIFFFFCLNRQLFSLKHREYNKNSLVSSLLSTESTTNIELSLKHT